MCKAHIYITYNSCIFSKAVPVCCGNPYCCILERNTLRAFKEVFGSVPLRIIAGIIEAIVGGMVKGILGVTTFTAPTPDNSFLKCWHSVIFIRFF